MTKRQRKVLFWASTLIFIAAVIPIMLYSFGYRFSFSDWHIVRAGGLSISSVPSTGTRIYIDNKLEKETSILSRSLFLQGLTPGPYTIRIEKDGYFSWKKTLVVSPERVTEAHGLLVRDGTDEMSIAQRGSYTTLSFVDVNERVIRLADAKKKNTYFSLDERAIVAKPTNVGTTTPALPRLVRTFIADRNIKEYTYDEDNERLVWIDANQVRVKWFVDEAFLPLYTEKSEDLIFTSPQPIRQVMFYPGQEALLIGFANEIRAVELDGRDGHNQYSIYKGREPHFLTSKAQKTIYALDDGNLILIPIL